MLPVPGPPLVPIPYLYPTSLRFFWMGRVHFQPLPSLPQIGLGLAMGAQFIRWGPSWTLQLDQCGAPDWALPAWGSVIALIIG